MKTYPAGERLEVLSVCREPRFAGGPSVSKVSMCTVPTQGHEMRETSRAENHATEDGTYYYDGAEELKFKTYPPSP